MQTYFDKMKEYLKMEDEIPFKEFSDYTQGFMGFLGSNLDTLGEDDLLTARFMVSILQGNAADRAKRKSPEAKKYKKMADKSTLWFDALTLRLLKGGISPEDIDKRTQGISDSVEG